MGTARSGGRPGPPTPTLAANPAPSPSHRVTTVRHSSTFPSRTSTTKLEKDLVTTSLGFSTTECKTKTNEEFLCKLQCIAHLQLIFKGSPRVLWSTIALDNIHNKPEFFYRTEYISIVCDSVMDTSLRPITSPMTIFPNLNTSFLLSTFFGYKEPKSHSEDGSCGHLCT